MRVITAVLLCIVCMFIGSCSTVPEGTASINGRYWGDTDELLRSIEYNKDVTGITTSNNLADNCKELNDTAMLLFDTTGVRNELSIRYPYSRDWDIEVVYTHFDNHECVYYITYRYLNTDVEFSMAYPDGDSYTLTEPINIYYPERAWVVFTQGTPANSKDIYDRLFAEEPELKGVYSCSYIYGDDVAQFTSVDNPNLPIIEVTVVD